MFNGAMKSEWRCVRSSTCFVDEGGNRCDTSLYCPRPYSAKVSFAYPNVLTKQFDRLSSFDYLQLVASLIFFSVRSSGYVLFSSPVPRFSMSGGFA